LHLFLAANAPADLSIVSYKAELSRWTLHTRLPLFHNTKLFQSEKARLFMGSSGSKGRFGWLSPRHPPPLKGRSAPPPDAPGAGVEVAPAENVAHPAAPCEAADDAPAGSGAQAELAAVREQLERKEGDEQLAALQQEDEEVSGAEPAPPLPPGRPPAGGGGGAAAAPPAEPTIIEPTGLQADDTVTSSERQAAMAKEHWIRRGAHMLPSGRLGKWEKGYPKQVILMIGQSQNGKSRSTLAPGHPTHAPPPLPAPCAVLTPPLPQASLPIT
jgi:hypothetical protein